MDNWAEIRRRVLVDGLGKRAACREFHIHWDTLTKILTHPEPPGYRRTAPRPRPKLDPFLPVIHQILEGDKKAPRKQRHTARRIFERLRDEYGYTGGSTVVKDAVRAWRRTRAEVFVPLAHRPRPGPPRRRGPRPAGPTARRRPGRLRRAGGAPRRAARHRGPVRHDPAVLGCHLLRWPPARAHRGAPCGTRARLRFPRRRE